MVEPLVDMMAGMKAVLSVGGRAVRLVVGKAVMSVVHLDDSMVDELASKMVVAMVASKDGCLVDEMAVMLAFHWADQ